MRRIVIAIGSTLTGLVLLFSWPTSLNRGVAAAAPIVPGTTTSNTTAGGTGGTTSSGAQAAAPAAPAAKSGTFTGSTVQTPYGPVQVQITVAGGKVTAANAVVFPKRSGLDVQINGYAIPILNSEVVSASNASIQMVSGATYTSNGYIGSLQSAIDQAGL